MDNRIKLRIIIVVILLLLDSMMIYHSITYSRDKCSITFQSQSLRNRLKGLDSDYIKMSLDELYGGYINGSCIIFWDNQEGYSKNNYSSEYLNPIP